MCFVLLIMPHYLSCISLLEDGSANSHPRRILFPTNPPRNPRYSATLKAVPSSAYAISSRTTTLLISEYKWLQDGCCGDQCCMEWIISFACHEAETGELLRFLLLWVNKSGKSLIGWKAVLKSGSSHEFSIGNWKEEGRQNRANTLTGHTEQIWSSRGDERSYTWSLCGKYGWWWFGIYLWEERR